MLEGVEDEAIGMLKSSSASSWVTGLLFRAASCNRACSASARVSTSSSYCCLSIACLPFFALARFGRCEVDVSAGPGENRVGTELSLASTA